MRFPLLQCTIGSCAALLLSIGLLLLTIRHAQPIITNVLYQVDGGDWHEATLPLVEPTTGEHVVLRFDLALPSPSPTYFTLVPDDCLLSLTINERAYDGTSIPFCDTSGADFSLKQYLHRGKNAVTAVLRDDGGDLKFSMHPLVLRDPIFLWPKFLIAFSGALLLLCSLMAVTRFLRRITPAIVRPLP